MKIPGGHEYEYRAISPTQIRVERTYQRDLDEKRVARIVKAWNPDYCNEPKLNYRDGKYFVFDGQHTIAAWVSIFGDKPITCKIYKGMTWLDEMNAFVTQNGISKDPTTNDKLKAQYNGRDPNVVAMVDGAARAGYLVDFEKGQARRRIVATSTLFKAYMMLGAMQYVEMLETICEAWDADPDALSSFVIGGMARFFHAYYGQFRSPDLAKALKKISPAAIIRNARNSTTSGTSKYAKEILKAYNKGRTAKRLDDVL